MGYLLQIRYATLAGRGRLHKQRDRSGEVALSNTYLVAIHKEDLTAAHTAL